jgi:ABC-type sugar transport system ATPase subunit
VPSLVTLYCVTPTVPDEGEIVGATVLIGAGRETETEVLVEVAEVEYVEFTAVTTKR